MHVPASNGKKRLLVATVSTLIATWLYVMASAQAVAHGGSISATQLLHPWESARLTVCILCVCAFSGITVAPVLGQGTAIQRVGAGCVLALPALMLAHFGIVVAHAAIWAARELIGP
jgi:hydrogenase-4 membrane subunit HyfE